MIWFRFAWTWLTTRCCFLLRTAFTRLLILNQLGVGSWCSLPIENYRVFAGCSGHRILQATTITWITGYVSVCRAPHLFSTDSLMLLFARWLAAVFMPWWFTLMIFSSSEVLKPNVKWDLSLLSARFILSDLMWAGVKSFLLLSALHFWELNLIPHLWL